MKCQVLDEDKKQCNRKAVGKIGYHGDREIYPYNFSNRKYDRIWVSVWVCKIHDDEMGEK